MKKFLIYGITLSRVDLDNQKQKIFSIELALVLRLLVVTVAGVCNVNEFYFF